MIIGVLFLSTLLMAFMQPVDMLKYKYSIKDVQVRFEGKHTKGTLHTAEGTVVFDPLQLENSTFSITIPLTTLNTGPSTKHALSEDWLDAARFPVIRFTSQGTVRKEASGQYVLAGDLSLHGVTRAIEIPFEYTRQGKKATFSGVFALARRDYGMVMPGRVADTLNVSILATTILDQ
ncbi:MAG: YceI family protein [Bacteroidetes bacterium]|nr:YceI family protein [Bacteroidota bacterium]